MNVRVELVAREGTPEAARKRGNSAWIRSQPHNLGNVEATHFLGNVKKASISKLTAGHTLELVPQVREAEAQRRGGPS